MARAAKKPVVEDDDDEEEDEEEAELPDPVRFGRALELEWDGAFWSGGLRLRSLDRYVDDDDHELLVEIESEDGELAKPVRAGLTWLLANEQATTSALLDAVIAAYPRMRAEYLDAGVEAADLPPALTRKNLSKHVGVVHLTVHTVVYGRRPYLGFGLSCTWDSEHGLGVMMHGSRFVGIGGADSALFEEYAETDRKQRRRKRAKPRRKR